MSSSEDIVHRTLGERGKYQFLINAFTSLFYIPAQWQLLSMNFLAPGGVDFWCAQPNGTQLIFEDVDSWRNFSHPVPGDGCEIYDINYENTTRKFLDEIQLLPAGTPTKLCDTFYEYDSTLWTETIISKWDLVCGSRSVWLKSFGNAFLMTGAAVGLFVTGQFSDHFGRRKTLILLILTTFLAATSAAFSPDFWLWLILRWITYGSSISFLSVTFVHGVEFLSGKHRSLIGLGFLSFVQFGIAILPGLAYICKNSFWLQIAMALCNVPLLVIAYCIPESPRWLISKGRLGEAKAVLSRGAEINGAPLTAEFDDLLKKEIDSRVKESSPNLKTAWKTSPKFRQYLLLLTILWFAHGFTFYGLGLNVANLGGNVFVSSFIFGCVGIPAYMTGIVGLIYFRRKLILSVPMIMTSVCLVATVLLHDYDNAKLTVAMIATYTLVTSYSTLYMYTVEVFPTVVRNVGLGTSSMFSRIGSIIVPLTFSLSAFNAQFFPTGLLAIVFLMAASTVIWLPETKGKPLKKNLDELDEEHHPSDAWQSNSISAGRFTHTQTMHHANTVEIG